MEMQPVQFAQQKLVSVKIAGNVTAPLPLHGKQVRVVSEAAAPVAHYCKHWPQ